MRNLAPVTTMVWRQARKIRSLMREVERLNARIEHMHAVIRELRSELAMFTRPIETDQRNAGPPRAAP